MLRITTLADRERVTLKLEGKLTGPWVAELVKIWLKVRPGTGGRPVTVDLCEVGFVDEHGKNVLRAMWQSGAELLANGPLMNAVVEELVDPEQAGPGKELQPEGRTVSN